MLIKQSMRCTNKYDQDTIWHRKLNSEPFNYIQKNITCKHCHHVIGRYLVPVLFTLALSKNISSRMLLSLHVIKDGQLLMFHTLNLLCDPGVKPIAETSYTGIGTGLVTPDF